MFHTLVFSGGANCAAVFFGCIRYLEHTGLRPGVKKVVGSSAGALVALLFALGLPSERMKQWMCELVDKHKVNCVSIDNALDMYDTLGLDTGSNLATLIRATMLEFGFSEQSTFKDLAQRTGVDFAVCTLNVTRGSFEYLSVDSAPLMPLVTAVRMTTAVPLLFTPVAHSDCLYVDPVLGRNFPFDFPGRNPALDPMVLGMSVRSHTELAHPVHPGLAGYVVRLLAILVRQSNETCGQHAFTMVTVDIDEPPGAGFSSNGFEFVWSEDVVAKLSHVGYQRAKEVIERRFTVMMTSCTGTEVRPQPDELLHHEDQKNARHDVHEHLKEERVSPIECADNAA